MTNTAAVASVTAAQTGDRARQAVALIQSTSGVRGLSAIEKIAW